MIRCVDSVSSVCDLLHSPFRGKAEGALAAARSVGIGGKNSRKNSGLSTMVPRHSPSPKLDVAGSNLVSRSNFSITAVVDRIRIGYNRGYPEFLQITLSISSANASQANSADSFRDG